MNGNFEATAPAQSGRPYRGPYQEIAAYVRNLLGCDYALVALPEKDSIRVQGFAGRDDEPNENLTASLIEHLRDWGPAVVDDARIIASPVCHSGQVIGVLIGYASTPGSFTTGDLERLSTYSHMAAAILTNSELEVKSETNTVFTVRELMHLSRLITMGELTACFAHEVTNPLTLIRGHLRFIDETLSRDHPLRVNFEVIDRASRRIEEMTHRMLDFSKKKPRRARRYQTEEIIAEALCFTQPHLRSNFIETQIQLGAGLPAILADRAQMVQAIVNLVQNAADAMLDVDRRILTVTSTADDKRLQIKIGDTGKGIAPGNLPKIFKPFFTTKSSRGTGLGLYITKQVIEEQRGTIEVQSDDRGTTFVISLPL